jgi:hypothetical protein
MRLNSEIWVKAYLRRCARAGAGCVLERRGDGARGAIYIKVSKLDGTGQLFSPAPSGLDTADEERRFQPGPAAVPEAEIDVGLARQVNFDPDLWIVAVEDREGRHFLDDWLSR